MDDGAADGTNQLTRLRTASGHQMLMHDTEGVVYIANGSGKAFIEMDTDGTVSVLLRRWDQSQDRQRLQPALGHEHKLSCKRQSKFYSRAECESKCRNECTCHGRKKQYVFHLKVP